MQNNNSSNYRDERVLILTPIGRDAQMTARFLAEAKLNYQVCSSIEALCQELTAGCGLIFLTGEALTHDALGCLVKTLSEQPTWSDVPLLVLTSGGSETPVNAGELTALSKVGNVTQVERPVRAATLLSTLQSALRARRHQYDVRDHLEEERRNREALRQSEERLRIALDAAQLGAWELNLTTGELHCTSICKRNFGLSSQDIFNYEVLLASIHPDDRKRMSTAVEEAIQNYRAYRAEYRIYWPDGTLHWILATGRANYTSSGQPYNMVGVTLDITERKTAEAQRELLLKQEQEARAEAEAARIAAEAAQTQVKDILEAITDGFISIDHNWCYTYINRAGAEMASQPPEYFIGKNIWEIFPDAVGTAYETAYRRAMIEQVPVTFEEYLPSTDMWLDVAAYPSADGLSVFFRDVSARRKAEEERERLLASEQAARAEAETASRLKDEFLATVSHELRTPLQSILGWTSLLRSEDVDNEMHFSALETIERNAQAQAQLIDDILDVSRIVTGKMRLNVGEVGLSSIIEAAVNSARPAAQAKDIQLEVSLQAEVDVVSGDAARLQQVVWNLLTNAVKFTPQSGQVQVQLKDSHSHLEIVVSDSGKGIEPEFLSHVFDRFRQADQTSTRRFGGLGLGLSIVRQIVDLHGGSVHAKSEGLGHGATFIVRLPRLISTSETLESKPKIGTPRALAENELPDFKGIRILVVEDEDDARHVFCMALRLCGSQVMPAASVDEALTILHQWHPQILISDIGMPVKDGYSLIKEVRSQSLQNGGDIPAVALTAYVREEDQKRALEAGFQLHLSKPIEPDQLTVAVFDLAQKYKLI